MATVRRGSAAAGTVSTPAGSSTSVVVSSIDAATCPCRAVTSTETLSAPGTSSDNRSEVLWPGAIARPCSAADSSGPFGP